jgi:hypothetical protein
MTSNEGKSIALASWIVQTVYIPRGNTIPSIEGHISEDMNSLSVVHCRALRCGFAD